MARDRAGTELSGGGVSDEAGAGAQTIPKHERLRSMIISRHGAGRSAPNDTTKPSAWVTMATPTGDADNRSPWLAVGK